MLILEWQLELLSMARSASSKAGGKGFGERNLERNLLCCLGSGSKMIEIYRGMFFAAATYVLQYSCSITIEPSILQQCLRLRAVSNTWLCQPVCACPCSQGEQLCQNRQEPRTALGLHG